MVTAGQIEYLLNGFRNIFQIITIIYKRHCVCFRCRIFLKASPKLFHHWNHREYWPHTLNHQLTLLLIELADLRTRTNSMLAISIVSQTFHSSMISHLVSKSNHGSTQRHCKLSLDKMEKSSKNLFPSSSMMIHLKYWVHDFRIYFSIFVFIN